MIEEDIVGAVIGLGKNLFYNSSMESCLLVCNMNKPKKRKGKIIFTREITRKGLIDKTLGFNLKVMSKF